MSEFDERLRELTHEVELVLDEDLASLQKRPDQSRIERYNILKANEEEFLREFTREYPSLTSEERNEVRSKFRLARLLVAASFYDEGNLPRAIADDFIEAELQAVVDFDRYKRFDVLSEEQIEEKIRRMEGEVYELVTEYTSTQIANMDELMDNPDVQQDVMEALVDEYEERFEKVRQGFFTYVETHGLEHMVEAIEDAVRAVSEASDEREAIREELQAEMESLSATLREDFQRQQRTIEAQLQSVEYQLSSEAVSREGLQEELEQIQEQEATLSADQTEALEELATRIDHATSLEERLENKIDELERVQQETVESARASAREETADIVADELEALQEEREQLRSEIANLEREREQIKVARDRLEDHQEELSTQVSDVQESLESTVDELPDKGVSASMARLLELDYVGRVDTSINDAESIYTPDGQFSIPDGYWDGRGERRNELMRLARLLDDEENTDRYPMNRSVRYEVSSSRFLGLSHQREMIIEGKVTSNLEAHAANGFDATPADLDDLLEIVNRAVHEAEQSDYHYLLAVASPTGWTDQVITQLENDDLARARYSRHLTLLLIDLGTGEMIYDSTDDIAEKNRSLFEIPVDAERVEQCVQVIRSNYIDEAGVDNVLLEEIVENKGFDVHVARQAFDQIAAKGEAEQLYVDNYGTALDF